MIVRTGNRKVLGVDTFDLGRAPAGVDGLASVEALALRAESFVAPVTRRTITDEERAALSDEPDVRVVAVASRERIVSTEAKRRAASLRGAQMAAARWDTLARHSMPTIWQAIRDADGVVYQAAQALGQDPANVRRRVRGHIDEAPDDVRALLAQHRGRQRSPATRALMSIRGRERWAMRKAVAA